MSLNTGYRDASDATKSLVFSSWSLVPDAIATICSYEAERQMITKLGADLRRDALYDQLRPLLRFTRDFQWAADGNARAGSTLSFARPREPR